MKNTSGVLDYGRREEPIAFESIEFEEKVEVPSCTFMPDQLLPFQILICYLFYWRERDLSTVIFEDSHYLPSGFVSTIAHFMPFLLFIRSACLYGLEFW